MSRLLYLKKGDEPPAPFELLEYAEPDGGRLHGPTTLAELRLATLEMKVPGTDVYVRVAFHTGTELSIRRFTANSEDTPLAVRGKGAGPEGGAEGSGAVVQESGNAREQLSSHLLPAPLPAIPGLNAVQQLFSSVGNYKVPVSHSCAQLCSDSAVAGLVVGVAESRLTFVTNFLVAALHAPGSNAAESSSTTLIQEFITNIFHVFSDCWPHGVSFAYEELHNQVESSTAMPSTVRNTRLDTMIVSIEKHVAVFFGEDKKAGGHEAAKADLITKLLKLPLTYLGHETLQYHLAYTIDGRIARLHAATFIVHQNDVQVVLEPLGRACDLSTPGGRALLIINLAKVYTVLECIVRCVPACKAVFPHGHTIKNTNQHGWHTTLQFGLDRAVKTITGFMAYCAYFHTRRSIIEKAFKAAKDAAAVLPPGARPYMVPGTVSAKRGAQGDTLSTTMEVVGMQQAPETEEEVQDLAAACCLTAKQLHAHNLVYKDWRSENVVRHVDTRDHMVVDLESVSAASANIAAEHVLPRWGPYALEDQRFTKASDMYQIGLLIDGYLLHLQEARGLSLRSEARAWVDRLTCATPATRMTAEAALQHAWLAGTVRRRLCQEEQAH